MSRCVHLECVWSLFEKANNNKREREEGPISTAIISKPCHSSLWHLFRTHLSGSCSLSQHATCHLKIRDNYTVHTTGYWGSFYDPDRATPYTNSIHIYKCLLYTSPPTHTRPTPSSLLTLAKEIFILRLVYSCVLLFIPPTLPPCFLSLSLSLPFSLDSLISQ